MEPEQRTLREIEVGIRLRLALLLEHVPPLTLGELAEVAEPQAARRFRSDRDENLSVETLIAAPEHGVTHDDFVERSLEDGDVDVTRQAGSQRDVEERLARRDQLIQPHEPLRDAGGAELAGRRGVNRGRRRGGGRPISRPFRRGALLEHQPHRQLDVEHIADA